MMYGVGLTLTPTQISGVDSVSINMYDEAWRVDVYLFKKSLCVVS